MEATYKDEKGEIKHYEISYSAEMQKRIEKRLKINNILLLALLLFLVLLVIALIWRSNFGFLTQKLFCAGF